MQLRTATVDDADAIRRVARASWEADYPGIVSRESIREGVDEWYSDERLHDEIDESGSIVLVAERENGTGDDRGEDAAETGSDDHAPMENTGNDASLAGFAHGAWDGAGDGDVLRVYVHPDARGEGIGTALLEAMTERFLEEGADRVRAMVLADNDLGNAFYRDAGFDLVEAEGAETVIGGERYAENVYVTDR